MQTKLLIAFLSLTLLIYAKSFAQKTKQDKPKCRATEYSLSNTTAGSGNNEGKTTYYWLYDGKGRLVGDSICNSTGCQIPGQWNEYFTYSGDSVISTTKLGDTLVIKLTDQGLPESELHSFGVKYQVWYAPDGALKKMQYVQPMINKRGQFDYYTMTSDSIIYINDDIASYWVHFSDLPDSSFMVRCTYYDDTVRSIEFYPIGRLTGLSNNPMSQFGQLNVSLFSKHLVKKMECPHNGNSLLFEFQFDWVGKVTGFDRTFSGYYQNRSYNTTDHSTVSYSCK